MAPRYFSQDTIVAVATPPGEGGVGIIRISGPQAPQALGALIRGTPPIQRWESHRLYYGSWVDPATGQELDQGLSVWMRAPRSFTGEEVVELQAHGGPLILNRLLEALLQQGLRVAEPGEFTRRAFLNGQMDLLQAEAVGEMIGAKSELALTNAQRQLSGRISSEVAGLRDRLIGLMARLEAAIDFPDEDIEILSETQINEELDQVLGTLRQWEGQFSLGRLLRDGVQLALVGRPNVGKSSLLNRWTGEDRAIVHASPGTTRDTIEGRLSLGGVHCRLVDTAGIRHQAEAVEAEGIARTQRSLAQADWTLWVVDLSQPWNDEDQALANRLRGPTLLLGNKCDLEPALFEPPEELWQSHSTLHSRWFRLSAKTGVGLAELERELIELLGLGTLAEHSQAYLNNSRHRQALVGAREALDHGQAALDQGLPPECVAADVRAAADHLQALLGEVDSEAVLDRIFSEFCLGK